MKRRLFNVLAGLSLVLCLATASLWVRCYLKSDMFAFITPSYEGQIWFQSGKALLQIHNHNPPGQIVQWEVRHYSGPASRDRHLPWWRNNLPTYRRGPMDALSIGQWDRVLSVPFWLLFPTIGLLPGWLVLRAWGRVVCGGCDGRG
jgi:hypothetical protein